MISYSSTQLEESYQELVKGNIKSSKRIFSHLMSENSLEVLDLAESVNDTICATKRGSVLNQSNTSLTSNTSSVSLFSATSATNDTNTSACSVSERGHIRTNRLKRRFNEAVKGREDPLIKHHFKHLKRALVTAISKLQSLPDRPEGYLESAAVMCLLSHWDVAEEIYEIGLQRCQRTTNHKLEFQLSQLRSINRHISDTLSSGGRVAAADTQTISC